MDSHPKYPIIRTTIKPPNLSLKQQKFSLILPIFFSKDIHSQLYSNKENKKEKNNLPQLPLSLINSSTYSSPKLPLHSNKGATMILDWLYLGSFDNASDKTELKSMKINFILNCAIECKNLYPLDFYYKHLKISDEDTFNIIDYFSLAIAFIEKARSSQAKIFIHCQMGISRSTTIVIAYLMKYHHFSLKKAFVYVKSRRSQTFPNFGFMEQLIKYDSTLKRKSI